MKLKQLRQMVNGLTPEVRQKVMHHIAQQQLMSQQGLIGANEVVSFTELQKLCPEKTKANLQNILNPAEVISQNKSFSNFNAIWETSLSLLAETLRKTLNISDAIDAGLNYIKETDWYNNLSEKKDFENKYIVHLQDEFDKFEKEYNEDNI